MKNTVSQSTESEMNPLAFIVVLALALVTVPALFFMDILPLSESEGSITDPETEELLLSAHKAKDISILESALEDHPSLIASPKFFDLYIELTPDLDDKSNLFHEAAGSDRLTDLDIRLYGQTVLYSMVEARMLSDFSVSEQPIDDLREILRCMEYGSYENCKSHESS